MEALKYTPNIQVYMTIHTTYLYFTEFAKLTVDYPHVFLTPISFALILAYI